MLRNLGMLQKYFIFSLTKLNAKTFLENCPKYIF